jgi:hypothetical protein
VADLNAALRHAVYWFPVNILPFEPQQFTAAQTFIKQEQNGIP